MRCGGGGNRCWIEIGNGNNWRAENDTGVRKKKNEKRKYVWEIREMSGILNNRSLVASLNKNYFDMSITQDFHPENIKNHLYRLSSPLNDFTT